MKENNSSTGQIIRHLMSMVEKMKKEEKLSSGPNILETTRNGMLYILTNLRTSLRKELMKSSDSMSIDHSTLYPDFQCGELFKLKEATKSTSTDGLRTELLNNGGSTQFLRPLEINTGRTTAWKSQAVVEQMNLKSLVQSHPDGGRCSNGMVP